MIDFRSVFLPCCIERLDDGSYVVLNRNDKPVGLTVENWIRYQDHPVRIRLKGLTPERIAAIGIDGGQDAARILLYDDSCLPMSSAGAWEAYGRRLQALAELAMDKADGAEPEFVEVPGFPVFRTKAR